MIVTGNEICRCILQSASGPPLSHALLQNTVAPLLCRVPLDLQPAWWPEACGLSVVHHCAIAYEVSNGDAAQAILRCKGT